MKGHFAIQIIIVHIELFIGIIQYGISANIDDDRSIDDARQACAVDAAALGIVVIANVIEIASADVNE